MIMRSGVQGEYAHKIVFDLGIKTRANRKRSAVDEESDAVDASSNNHNSDETFMDAMRDVIREEIRAELSAQLAPLMDIMNGIKAGGMKTCKCQNADVEKRYVKTYDNQVPSYLSLHTYLNLDVSFIYSNWKNEQRARSMLPLDKDEHVMEVVNDPEIRRAVALLIKELPLEKTNNRMMMVRKFLFADSYLLIKSLSPRGLSLNMAEIPCSLHPLLHDIYDVTKDSFSRDNITSRQEFIMRFR